MKGNKGITLIALVVTIIVLLILAGVSIAMLTGENGLLTRSKEAKITQLEADAAEEVRLAIGAVKIMAEQKAVTTAAGYLACDHMSDVKSQLEADLTSAKHFSVGTATNAAPAGGTATITVVYNAPDYAKATNTDGATITYTITVTANTIELTNTAYNPLHTN